jgi:hypothetical protein
LQLCGPLLVACAKFSYGAVAAANPLPKRMVLVLTLGRGQSGQPEAKMPNKSCLQAKMPKQMSTLSQNVEQYFNPRLKISRIF